MTSYDVIGDIHGYAGKLEGLLKTLGYTAVGKTYKAPIGRQAVFLGDLIDRGPEQVRVLEIVRGMVDSGDALCIMGNHEFNAIGYATDDPLNPGEALRPNRVPSSRAIKNRQQHADFLAQISEGSDEHKVWVEWFKTLPPFMDLGGIRVVHGSWDDQAVEVLSKAGWKPGSVLTDELLFDLGRVDTPDGVSPLKDARKLLTCGLEMVLPQGRYILDTTGHRHEEIRIANWRDWAKELHEVALVPSGQEDQIKGLEWTDELVVSAIQGTPVFIGHHWFSGDPKVECAKLACLDWSAAKDGPLVAYRWDGETELSDDKLMWEGK
jgi:hypothetical protein